MLASEALAATLDQEKARPPARLPSADVLRRFPPAKANLLKRLLSERAECVPNEFFDRPDAERLLMGSLLEAKGPPAGQPTGSEDGGAPGLPQPDRPPARMGREQYLFLRLNFCRWRVLQVLCRYPGKRLSPEAVRELLKWKHAEQETRNEIVRANVALVLAMAKRTRITGVDLTDLISEGNLALLRSVDKFDCARGYKFSTYACRAILKSFSRVASRASRHRRRFPTEFDPALEKSDYIAQRRAALEVDCVDELKAVLGENLARLSDVERKVIRARFALDETDYKVNGSGKTLEQVGQMIGVTKERVRQIQNKALGKLRAALERVVLPS